MTPTLASAAPNVAADMTERSGQWIPSARCRRFGVLLVFMVPAIIGGEPPVLVAVVAASAITLVVLHLTHGVSLVTTVAVVGTMAALALTAVLSELAVEALYLTGVTDDISMSVVDR